MDKEAHGQGLAATPGGAGLAALLDGASAHSTALLVIDLAAIAENYRKLKAAAAGAACAAVVKADAYGLGLAQVVPALTAAGCSTFFVATLAEAHALRAVSGDATLYVLDGLFADSAPAFAAIDARPVLGTCEEIAEWVAFCRDTARVWPAALHVDTGMNRLGLARSQAAMLAERPELLHGMTVSLVMSHLACADEAGHPMNAAQRDAFSALAGRLPAAPRSLANSAGVFLGPFYHYDLVRPGIALYGGNPFADRANVMAPVVRLFGRIVQMREAGAGETVGYGARRRLVRDSRIATVAVGYADGYLRLAGSSDDHEGAVAHIGAHRLPILGRVSMDLITFDATDLPEGLARRGGFVELLGPRFTVDDLAACARTIGYEVLTRLGARYQRLYLGAPGEA